MKTEKKIYYPLFASRQLNGGFQDEQESKEVWDSLMALPDDRRNIILSQNIAEAIALLDEQFHIPEQFVEYVTVLTRDLFLGTFSEQEVLRALRNEFAKLPNVSLDPVIQHIQLHVFKAEPDPERIEEEEEDSQSAAGEPDSLKKYTLLDAMSRFPGIGNQFITKESIKLKGQAALVRPTLSNWLKNYRDEIGIGKHDAVTRAHFLFESPNTEKLSSEERERLHALVRSLEDNELLDIDTKTQEIYFSAAKKEEAHTQSPIPQAAGSAPDIFERFQNPSAYREDLKNVGTQKFLAPQPMEPKEPMAPLKAGNDEDVLSRIKNMKVTPGPIHAPAPKEDFWESEQEGALKDNNPEYLGTLRFSAKHVLPAEKQAQGAPAYVPNPPSTRPQGNISKPFTIAKEMPPQVQARPVSQPLSPLPVSPVQASVVPNPPKPVPVLPLSPQTPSPKMPPKNLQPTSIFRIKPNKNEPL